MIPKNNEIRFEVTTHCNYNCTMCARNSLKRKLETMDLYTFKLILRKILNETNQYNVCTFSGFGEPLLDKGLTEKIRFALTKNLKVLILTNGSLLDKNLFIKFNQLGVESVRISLYGNSEQTYYNIHGKLAFKQIKKTILEILDIPKRRTKLLLTYNVLDGINEFETQEWIDFWKNKADLIEVWTPHNWVDEKNYRLLQTERLKTCGRPFNGPIQIQVDGTVVICCFDYNGELYLGDLKIKSLEEIFNSFNFRDIAEFHKTGKFEGSGLICENCDQRNASKKDIMIYSSKFKPEERIKKFSTSYKEIL